MSEPTLTSDVSRLVEKLGAVKAHLNENIIGHDHVVSQLIVAILADAHVLLEGFPGLAKTSMIRSISECFHLHFSRLQFTPDLLPADITGTQVYDPRKGEFYVRRGPVFANMILADEINRAPAKVQSALLEAMQERQVTIGGETLQLPQPFMVLATQNPIEQEGTYQLPEAQADRFLFKLRVNYGSLEDEQKIIQKNREGERRTHSRAASRPQLNVEELLTLRNTVSNVHVDDRIDNYIARLVVASRPGKEYPAITHQLSMGASPRASIGLDRAARAQALINGRMFVTPRDVKAVAPDVLRHRLTLSMEAEIAGKQIESVIDDLLASVPVP